MPVARGGVAQLRWRNPVRGAGQPEGRGDPAGHLRPGAEPSLRPDAGTLRRGGGSLACRVRDPNRKGTVENAIQHTQSTALKGRKYEAIETQNAWLAHWEERWAAPRIHGRKKRQVLEMYHEEQPYLRPLPLAAFRYYKPGVRMVDDAGLVQVEGSYYAALPAPLHSEVQVRIYEQEIEIYGAGGHLLRRHRKSARKGQYVLAEEDRLFNPSRETGRLLAKAATIGPNTEKMARTLFAHRGRPGQKALYGLTSLVRRYARVEIEAVCGRLLAAECASYVKFRLKVATRFRAIGSHFRLLFRLCSCPLG